MKIINAVVLASTLLVTGQAVAQDTEAATLRDLNGKVLVNKGDGLKSGKADMALNDGDRIITLEKSGVRVIFPDGCNVTLEENMIFVIDSHLGCKAAVMSSNQTGAPGLTTSSQGLITGTLVVGGAALLGNAIFKSNSQDNQPISRQ